MLIGGEAGLGTSTLKVAGAILISYPREAQAVAAAVQHRRDVSPHPRALEDGVWQVVSVVN